MFGWEFPPQITGGLGTACYGITKGLSEQNVNVLFVVPKTFGNEDRRYTTLQDAGEIPSKHMGSYSKAFWRKIQYKEVKAKLIPYTSPEDYKKKLRKTIQKSETGKKFNIPDFIPFSGKYGIDLWDEIERYSLVTSLLVRKENFDIIHAHEWLTFPFNQITKCCIILFYIKTHLLALLIVTSKYSTSTFKSLTGPFLLS
jgi:glycogen synthase